MYFLAMAAEGALSFAFALIGMSNLEVIAVPVLPAVYAGRGDTRGAAGLAAAAVIGAGLAHGVRSLVPAGPNPAGWVFVLYYTGLALAGLVAGASMARRWTYGQTAVLLAGLVTAALGIVIATHWHWWHEMAIQAYSFFFESGPQQEFDEAQKALLEQVRWLMVDHWTDLSLGMLSWQVLAMSCITVSLTAALLRKRFGKQGPRGSFRTMRPPEALVWVAIAAAGLWMVNNQWPNDGLRVVAWNLGVVMTGVYWLSGLSIVLYALHVLKPGAFVYVAVVLLATLPTCGIHIPALLGLFDTWANFRVRVRALKLARERFNQSHREDL